MKKYFLGIAAVVLAISLSAFTAKPYSAMVFELKSGLEPVGATGSVTDDPANWVELGSGVSFGTCAQSPDDVACRIVLEGDNQALFYHVNPDNEDIIELNNQAYLDDGHSTQKKVVITTDDTFQPGSGPLSGKTLRIITDVTATGLTGTTTQSEGINADY